MLQGVLFDMDGVLFDTEKIYWRIEKELLQDLGLPVKEDLKDKVMGANHTQIRITMRDIYGPEFNFDKFTEIKRAKISKELKDNGVQKKEGVEYLLKYLKNNNYKIAVASSTRYNTVVELLKSADIFSYFDAIVGGDMIEKSKPEPDIFLAAAREIDVAPISCAAIEDSVNGVKSAVAAGCITIMVPDMIEPTAELKQIATAILPSLKDVPTFLEEYQ